ncbi:sulfate reduction electron transfer complex DsrMKJOP subunit DsrO [Elusimicrobiota bacterium]
MIDRRLFLKLAGLTTLAAAAGKFNAFKAFAAGTHADKKTVPGTKQWAMAIDLDKCSKRKNCDLCFKACHVNHNVPTMKAKKEEIKWIWKETFEHAFHGQEHEFINDKVKHYATPVLCNHCESPACTKVCPTKATWKRRSDGIVMMDWHRCIGCRYCMAACPYGSRSFNWRDPRKFVKKITKEFPTRARGVVEKCTFCDMELAHDKQPFCVKACKYKALVFGDLNDPKSSIRKLLSSRFSMTRKPGAGTNPRVYYLI